MDLIQRPKKVQKAEKGYLSNEKYQDYAENQFKVIYDYLDGRTKDISNILEKIGNLKVYYESWDTSIDFECPLGHHALMLCSQVAFYVLWNAPDNYHSVNIYGSGYTLTRDNNDKTKFTLSSNNNNSYTIIVF